VSRDRDLLEADSAIAKKMPNLRIVDPVVFLIAVRAQFGDNS